MKKALPYIAVVVVGLVALYLVYDFQTNRLTVKRQQDIRQAEQRLSDVEAEADETADEQSDRAPDQFKVAFDCSNGTFVVECHRDWAPNGVDRFYKLVKSGFYNDNRVFRVVKSFAAQFGISGQPALNAQWMQSTIPDDPVKESNTRGRLTFAAGRDPHSRSTQVFINLANNLRLDSMGFAPIGEVVEGMETVDGFFSGYGEQVTNLQQKIAGEGNGFLDQNFPKLSTIKRAHIVSVNGAESEGDSTAEPVGTSDSGATN